MQAETRQERQGREQDCLQAAERLNAVQRECDQARQEREAAQGQIAALKHAAEMLEATIEEEHGKEELHRIQVAAVTKEMAEAAKDAKAAKTQASQQHTTMEKNENGIHHLTKEYDRLRMQKDHAVQRIRELEEELQVRNKEVVNALRVQGQVCLERSSLGTAKEVSKLGVYDP